MNAILLTLTLLAGAPPAFEVRTLGDQSLVGTVTEFDGRHLGLKTADGTTTIDADKLVRIVPLQKPADVRPSAAVWIELVDGSTLAARDYTVRDARAHFTLTDGQAVDLPAAEIAAVRLQAEDAASGGEWTRIRGTKLDGDLLVSRKGDNIDYHKGALGDVAEDVVRFTVDGETLPVKRPKVYGLVYYHPSSRQLPETICRLTDTSGAQWAVHTLSLAGQRLQWTTPSGVSVARPLEAVAQIDFSGGKVVYLSDLKPDAVNFTPYFGADASLPVVGRFFAPRQDKNLESKPLSIGGKQYAKGLAMHSRTEMTYRLPAGFSRLKATAGIDDGVRPHGNVKLVIRGDDRVLLETTVAGSEPPKPIDLDVTGVHRIVILADFGAEGDVGDHLDLCELRVIK